MRMKARRASDEQAAPTRASLLSKLRSLDDHDSWQEFFDTYWKLIYSIAIKTGLSDGDAREVVQETIISLTRQLPRFKYDRSKGSFKSWLYRQTSWRVSDHLRREKKRVEQCDPLETSHENVVTAGLNGSTIANDRLWEEEWERNLIDLALGSLKKHLPPKQYQIFDLYVIRELPVPEVMATLNVSRTQIYLAKHRVTKVLKAEVESLRERLEQSDPFMK